MDQLAAVEERLGVLVSPIITIIITILGRHPSAAGPAAVPVSYAHLQPHALILLFISGARVDCQK